MKNNEQIIKSTITTGGFSGSNGAGILKPEQARKFIQQTFDATPLGKEVRHLMRTAKTGEIDKIGIARRILRKKVENTDDGYRADVNTSHIEYSTTAVRLPWEVTEETLRENIEGQNLSKIITDLMTTQLGIDLEDLYLNGDTAVDASDPDHDFLYINDGWVKQLKNGSNVVDESSTAHVTLDTYYNALQAIPNKYNNGRLRWLMSPHRRQNWERYLLNQAITNGGIISDKRVENPVSIPVIEVPALPDDSIILTDPQNLIVVNTYDMKIRSTTEGEKAIMEDKRFYVCHLDFDAIIEELEAAAIITGLKD